MERKHIAKPVPDRSIEAQPNETIAKATSIEIAEAEAVSTRLSIESEPMGNDPFAQSIITWCRTQS